MAEDEETLDDEIEEEPIEDLEEDLNLDDELEEESGEPENEQAGAGGGDDEEKDDEDDSPSAPKADTDDEEDDEADPDDVEADLDTILKDRIASGDDEAEEDEEEVAPPPTDITGERVAPKREDEWTCEGCFLIVSARQFGRRSDPRCPSGEDPCPSLQRVKD